MSAAVTVRAVANNGKVALPAEELQKYQREVRARHWADGVELTLRVEPSEEAWRYSDIKHYFGHLVAPFCAYTGYTRHEAHAEIFKGQFMLDGKSSLTELSRDELRAFMEQVEHYIREECPEVFEAQEQAS